MTDEATFVKMVDGYKEAKAALDAQEQAALNAETVTLTISKELFDLLSIGVGSANNEGWYSDEDLKKIYLQFFSLAPSHWDD
jgi:hypothetical protein